MYVSASDCRFHWISSSVAKKGVITAANCRVRALNDVNVNTIINVLLEEGILPSGVLSE